jgi:hypothetical protein
MIVIGVANMYPRVDNMKDDLIYNYCCNDLIDFLGTVTYKLRYAWEREYSEDKALYIGYKSIAGFEDANFKFCPFCGKKIAYRPWGDYLWK